MKNNPISDKPRLFANQSEIEKRKSLLTLPHIAPLTDYVHSLRKLNLGDIPYFDPWDGGVNAKILFLFEKPGPMASSSGFISRNNNDPTAENAFKFWQDAEISRELTCLWNTVPGWNGTRKITSEELRV